MNNKLKQIANFGQKFIDILIILVFIEAILTTYPWFEERFAVAVDWFDYCAMIIFCVEIGLRIIFGGKSFWVGKDWAWNWFDLIVTLVTVLTSGGAFASIRSLRLLRLLRLLRVFTIFDGLRILVGSLLRSIPKIGWLVALWLAIMIIYAVIGCHLFGADFPEWFGSLGATCYTMFQVMTLESWSMGIARPVMELYPLSSIYFVSYICVTAFVMLNALTGVLVTSMTDEGNAQKAQQPDGQQDDSKAPLTKEDIQCLLKKMEDLEKQIQQLQK